MATWAPYKDLNGDGNRPLEFTATAADIAKGVPVKFDAAGCILAATAATHAIVGITAEAITASTAGIIWTSGEFYSSAGGGGTAQVGDVCTYAAETTITVCSTGNHIWGVIMRATIGSGTAAYFKLISALDVGDNLTAA